MPFRKLEKLMRDELGAPLGDVFASFDERAFAAASIGQVHRATTLDGDDVVVKVQYPGIAEAVGSDLRSATLLLPLIRRLAPGLDAKGLFAELRERIGEELDYELEAQNQRRVERLFRGHPFIRVPRVRTDLSTTRVLVSEYVEGERFEAVRVRDQAERDRYGEIVFRFYFGLLYRHRSRSATRIPGITCCAPTGGSRSSTTAWCAISAPRASRPSGRSRWRCAPAIPPRWRRRWWPAATSPPSAPTAWTTSWR